MTPEQTLDWLAQQHFDQCREDRPVQHWIRKMKSELPEQEQKPVAWEQFHEYLVERNFCPRCGKRLASGFVEISIHTCTPPKDVK